MIDNYTKTPRPLRHVDVDYLVDQTKCAKCSDKPCLQSCPIDAIYLDNDDGLIKLKNTIFSNKKHYFFKLKKTYYLFKKNILFFQIKKNINFSKKEKKVIKLIITYF